MFEQDENSSELRANFDDEARVGDDRFSGISRLRPTSERQRQRPVNQRLAWTSAPVGDGVDSGRVNWQGRSGHARTVDAQRIIKSDSKGESLGIGSSAHVTMLHCRCDCRRARRTGRRAVEPPCAFCDLNVAPTESVNEIGYQRLAAVKKLKDNLSESMVTLRYASIQVRR